MAQVIEPAIDPNAQVVPPEDSDYITPDDKAALEAEKRGETPEPEKPPPTEPTPPPEPQKEPEKPEQVETRHDDRPEINRRIEQNRKERAERAREAQERAQIQEQLRVLREENLRYKTRAELEDEARRRLDDLKKQSERPDPDTDPYGYRLWSQEQALTELRQWKENREQQELQAKQQREQQENQQRQQREIINYLEQDAKDFMADHPDYGDAAAYVRKPLETLWRGAGASDQQVNELLFAYNMGLGYSAMGKGNSVAEQVYNAAMELGYKPRAASAAVQNGNGATPPQQQQQTAAQKIERAAKGQALQGLGGAKPGARNEEDDIAQMNEEALSELSDDDYIRIKQDPRLARVLNKKVEGLF
jgi:hypothetical protein